MKSVFNEHLNLIGNECFILFHFQRSSRLQKKAIQLLVFLYRSLLIMVFSIGAIVQEVKQWLTNADKVDLARLALIEGNVVNKFPSFNSFEEFGYGSFLRFLTKHKELLDAIEQVGGMARSGRVGTTLGHQVSLNSVLDFISQCGTQTSPVSFAR